MVTSILPFEQSTEIFCSGRLSATSLERLTHHAQWIVEKNGYLSYRLKLVRRGTPRNSSKYRLNRRVQWLTNGVSTGTGCATAVLICAKHALHQVQRVLPGEGRAALRRNTAYRGKV